MISSSVSVSINFSISGSLFLMSPWRRCWRWRCVFNAPYLPELQGRLGCLEYPEKQKNCFRKGVNVLKKPVSQSVRQDRCVDIRKSPLSSSCLPEQKNKSLMSCPGPKNKRFISFCRRLSCLSLKEQLRFIRLLVQDWIREDDNTKEQKS